LVVLSEEDLLNTLKWWTSGREKREEVGVTRRRQNSGSEGFQAVSTLPSGNVKLKER
jgi:hypothetical protein